MPFPDQRVQWDGRAAFQVVAIVGDDDTPIAYEVDGQRSALSKTARPQRATVVLTPAEQSFDALPVAFAQCNPEINLGCGDDGGGSGGGTSGFVPDTSLFMTQLKIDDDYESVFKGDPEFEVHILGPDGNKDSLTTHQCSGEHAGGPYAFDYNDVDNAWSGKVLLFSRAQLAAFKSAYAGKAFRVFVLEDDDDECVLHLDGDRMKDLFTEVASNSPGLGGVTDSTVNLVKVAKAGNALYKVVTSVISFFQSADDMIGVALEDSVVGQYFSGANFVIRGPGNATKGSMKLEMLP